MKLNKRIWTVALAAVLFIGSMSTPTLAFSDDSAESSSTTDTESEGINIEPEVTEEILENTEDTPLDSELTEDESEGETEDLDTSTAFTPDGTGTVMDTATDADGKLFYTITTESGAVYYLIIDNERTENNVYFLNAVTEEDLLSLAESSDTDTDITDAGSLSALESDTNTDGTQDVETDTDEDNSSPTTAVNSKSMIFIVLAVIVAGVAGYYFKIYKPNHTASFRDDEDEYEEDSDEDIFGDEDDNFDDDEDEYIFPDDEED